MDEAVIASADTSNWIAVLPLGAHEQHGPHLPFETDSIIADGVACRLAGSLANDLPVTFLPTERIGYSIEHIDVAGTKSLAFDEAIEKWMAIGEKLSGLGIRKLLLLNAHGGNSPLMTIVATELRVRCDVLCVATAWTRFLVPGDIFTHEEKAFGIHGGDIETSVMLALAPETVDMSKAEKFGSFQASLVEDAKHLRAYGPHAFGWKMRDLNRQGVTGDASVATAEKGEALLDQAASGLKELIADMIAFDLAHFDG
ncbi:MAG: creatininase family protein [Rhizobiaceae bacterium]|nr:creatininase family protein [Rhizobiaceae bacterium]